MADTSVEQAEYRGEALAVRAILGGALMGLANLVPGISGGTMLLAVGVYPHFVRGIAEVTTLKFRARTILTLACVVGAALLAVVGLAGPVSELVVHHRWIMYALFIGLTLGGVPVLWPMVRPLDPVVVVAALVGIGLMVIMALIGPSESAGNDGSYPYGLLFLAGLAGASAMVLPGISGGYLLLLLGQYVAILSAVSAFKDAAGDADWAQLRETMHVIIPVGLGVVVGVVGVSNLVKWLLDRFERPTLGLLLGLLLGAVVGLWPFQVGVAPEPGSTFRGDTVVERDGELVLEETGRTVGPDAWPTEFFRPSPGQIGGALGLIFVGFAASWGVSHLGRGLEGRSAKTRAQTPEEGA